MGAALPKSDAYDRVPDAIRTDVTRKEFAWLSDRAKARLVDDFCTPDWID